MTSAEYAEQIRRVQWEHLDGRITFRNRCQREDRLWDRAFAQGGRELVQQVEREMSAQTQAGKTETA